MRASLDSLGKYEGMIRIPWRRARTQLAVVAMLLVAGLLYAPRAEAYDQYHPGDSTSVGDGCYQCHGWDNDLNPAWGASGNASWRNGGFDGRAALHDMHVSQITGNCDLCHISTGDGGFTSTSGDPDGEGCRGCHGVDNGTQSNWSAGLRTHHTNAGAPADQDGLFCDDCHGDDPAPQPENTVPVYYLRADVNAKDPCNADGTEDWGGLFGEPADVPDGFGVDNDGDLLYDGDDPDCATGCQSDAECDNGAFCDGVETCNTATGECVAGTPVDCDDGVGCTVDSCNEGTDSCDNTPDDAVCDNGLFCDGTETCDTINDCQAGTPPCDPATETCNEGGGICQPIGCQSDAECDNGAFCDGVETCNTATGECVAGTPVDCDDGVGCTVDSCNEGTDSCDNTPDDAVCDNGLFCDGTETCDTINDCQAGTPPCDPATETCNEGGGICQPIGCQSDAECDNGAFCDGVETCNTATGECVAGTPVDCDDGVGCTVDSCNEGTDSCDNTPDDAVCDNGLFCDGTETCDTINDCQAGTPPCDPATETCNEGGGICQPIGCQSDAECDNGAFCDGVETCNTATGECVAGTPVDCDDGVGCTVDSCNEGTDSCDNTPDDAVCDNGLFCDGTETCDTINDCQAGTPPCDPATETCNEVIDVCEATTAEVDLDIRRFKATKQVRLTSKKAPTITLKLVVKNEGTVNEPRRAVITGLLPDGTTVTVFDQLVSDEVGNGRTTFRASYTPPPPNASGIIEWTAEIFDDDPDLDRAMATTNVR